jgi:hypothetical protein
VRRSTRIAPFALDLHVLGTPPAFVLSQDQTLQLKIELFELAYLRLSPHPSRQALTGVPAFVRLEQESLFGTRRLRAGLPRGGSGRNVRIQLN